MEKKVTIAEIVGAARHDYAGAGYSRTYLRGLNVVWDRFESFAKTKRVKLFRPELTKEFLRDYQMLYGAAVHSGVTRAANVLNDYYNFGEKLRRTKLPWDDWAGRFEKEFSRYFEYYLEQRMGQRIDPSVRVCLRAFQEHLIAQGIRSLQVLDSSILYSFLEERYSNTQKRWKNRMLLYIRRFLEYLRTQDISISMLDRAFPTVRIYSDSGRIQNIFTGEEVSRMLAAVDRGGPLGKRDYAVLLLSERYGLRASDIVRLRFDNLDWNEKTIRIVQSKTGVELTLPLLEDVGWALIDYLNHGRPISSCPQIFVTHNAPHGPFMGSLVHLVAKYMKLAGIPSKPGRTPGFHAVRHGLATEMLQNNIPITSIKEVLGHASIHTTAQYQRMDMKQLAPCALEVPYVST